MESGGEKFEISDIHIRENPILQVNIGIRTKMKMDVENIWILFTNTNVVWDFETNVDMKLDISVSGKKTC